MGKRISDNESAHVMAPGSISTLAPEIATIRKRPPIAGLISLVTVCVALVGWTMQRLSAAEPEPVQQESAQTTIAPRASAAATNIAPRQVDVVQPVLVQWQPIVQLEGSLAPQLSTALAFSTSGTLSVLSVRVGDEVRAGARLAQLDISQAASQYAVSTARVRAATAQLEIAQGHADRSGALVASGSLQSATAIDTRLQSSVAAAELDAVQAQQRNAQTILNDHTLRAPFAGTVIEAPETVGAVITPGAPLMRLANLKTLKLSATVSESDATLVRVGAKVVIETAAGSVEGHITKLLQTLDAHTRRVPLEAEFESPGALHAGAFVRARVEATDPIPVLRLPREVLRPGTTDEVLVVAPTNPATLSVHSINADKDATGALLVRSGLTLDSRVVTHPHAESKSGDEVTVIDNAEPHQHSP